MRDGKQNTGKGSCLPESEAYGRMSSGSKYGKIATQQHSNILDVPLDITMEGLGRLWIRPRSHEKHIEVSGMSPFDYPRPW